MISRIREQKCFDATPLTLQTKREREKIIFIVDISTKRDNIIIIVLV